MGNTTLQDDMNALLANRYNGDRTGEDTPPLDTELPQVTNEYDVYIEPGRVTFIKKEPPAADTTPQGTVVPAATEPENEKPLLNQRESTQLASATIMFSLFLILFSLMLQLHIAFNPPTAVITIIPKEQLVTLSGRLQLGRIIHPITLSQQVTAKTTGHGHQEAQAARGSITFYNASFTTQTIPAGSIFVGGDGVQVQTDEAVRVPANNPPQDGIASGAAHATRAGSQGNITTLDINGVATSSLYVKNLTTFTGGQDERYFQVVKMEDIITAAQALKTTLIQSMIGALQGQLQNSETLQMVPCSPTTTADHDIGEEATQVTVTVSFTCSAVAYNEHTLQVNVTRLLTAKALKKLGAGYTMLGDMQVSVKRATVSPSVFLSFTAVSTWVYALNSQEQQRIKALVTGKTKQVALQRLTHLPGIESATMSAGDSLPHDTNHIHIIVMYKGS